MHRNGKKRKKKGGPADEMYIHTVSACAPRVPATAYAVNFFFFIWIALPLVVAFAGKGIDHMAEGGSPRKAKRTAEHQINKDEDPEGDGAGEEVVAGTFQRAPPEVLKARK